jgi:hypothetical protein
METRIEMIAVWGFTSLAFITLNGWVAGFAIAASVTTIIRNYPAVRDFIKELKK